MRISDWSSDVCSSDLPSSCADRKKETGCNGHPFPTMPHRLIVVGLGLDLFPLAGQEPAQRENFAGTFISIAVRGTQRDPVFKLGAIALCFGSTHSREPYRSFARQLVHARQARRLFIHSQIGRAYGWE